MSLDARELGWSRPELDRALRHVAAGLGSSRPNLESVPIEPLPADATRWTDWLEGAAARLGFEAEPSGLVWADRNGLVRAAPFVLGLSVFDEPRFLVATGGRRGKLRILRPDLESVTVPSAELFVVLDDLVSETVDDSPGRSAVARALVQERFADRPYGRLWLLRPDPHRTLWDALSEQGFVRDVFLFVAAHAAVFGLWIAAWRRLGPAAYEGTVSPSLVVGIGLVLLTMVPLTLLRSWVQARATVLAAVAVQRRLMLGVLNSDADAVLRAGVGSAYGRVVDAESIEVSAFRGGFLVVTGIIELGLSAYVLSKGLAGTAFGVLSAAWLGALALLGFGLFERYRRWTDFRLSLTHELTEKLGGHATRRVQESPERAHEDEDRNLSTYLELSRKLDRLSKWMQIAAFRGWLCLALGTLPWFLVSGPVTIGALAFTIGGILLAARAFELLGNGFNLLLPAAAAAKRISPILRRAERRSDPGLYAKSDSGSGESTLELRAVDYRYPGSGRRVIRSMSAIVACGDRVLLEGPSGCGKSTLAELIAGVRRPDAGSILLNGMDFTSIGASTWRRSITLTPQFNDNHVFSETLAFNLLMGRRWPADPADFAEADRLCRELELGPLLDRMPSGLLTQVGDGGWQLSHGEQSRVFLARALLQEPDILVVDESFAALDPDTLARCLETTRERSKTLVVIAHREERC